MLEAKKYCKMRCSREIFDLNQDGLVKWFVRVLERQNSDLKTTRYFPLIFHGATVLVPGVASWFTFMGTGGVSRIEGILKSLVWTPDQCERPGIPQTSDLFIRFGFRREHNGKVVDFGVPCNKSM